MEDGELVDIHERLNATQRARIAGLCSIRDHARALLDLQLADADDSRQRHERAMLNGSYDRYVARFGCLSNRANALAFRRDPDYPLLLSLMVGMATYYSFDPQSSKLRTATYIYIILNVLGTFSSSQCERRLSRWLTAWQRSSHG